MATQFAVDLVFKANGVDRELRKLQGGTTKLDAAVKKTQSSFDSAGSSANRASNNIRRFGSSAQNAARGIGALKTAIAGLGFGLLVRSVFSATAEFERYEKQLTTLTGTAGRAKAVIDQLDQINRKSPFDLPQLIRTSKTLSAMGIGYEKLVDTTERLGKVSAATGARVEEVALAYGQVAAKGKLQTEELYQFQERGIALGEELKRMLGLTGDELQEMISKGQIGFPLVEKAIQNLTGETGKFKDAFENTADTLDAKLSNMQSDFKKAAAALGNAFRPVFIWLLEQATKIANFLTDAINHFQRGAAGVEGVEKANAAADKLTRQKYGQMGLATMAFNPEVQKFWDQARKSALDNFNRQIDIKQGRRTVAPSVDAVPSAAPAASAAEIAANRQLLLQGQGQGQGQGKTGGGRVSSFKPSSRAQALIAAAKKLGVSPLDLATIISYETAGTFSPSIYGGAGGNYMGLIQFGPPERKQYGAHAGQSFEEQVMGPVVRFFQDRFAGVGRSTQGASLLDLYKTVNGGNPNVSAGLSDGNGTIGGHVQRMMGGHRQKALSTFFGGNTANVGYGSVDAAMNMTQGFEDMQKQKEIAAQLLADAKERLTVAQTQLAIEQQMDPIKAAQLESEERQRQIRKEYNDLIKKATEDETKKTLEKAKGIELQLEEVKLNKELKDLRESATKSIEDEIEMLQARLNGTEAVLQAEREIAALRRSGVDGGTAKSLVETRNQLQQQVEAQDKAKQSAEALAGSISSALTDSLRGLIDGSMTAEEALSNAFKRIGDAFLDMAMQMIQEWIKMQMIGLVSGMFGGATGGAIGGGGFGAGSFNLSGGQFGAFAEGGYVTGPTTAMIGEGGESEYVIPASKMGAAMSRYSRGARGESVIPGSGETAEGGGGTIDVSYSVVSINEQRFVTEEQFRAGIDSAAKRGAAGGHARSMSTLRNSRSQRTKLGL